MHARCAFSVPLAARCCRLLLAGFGALPGLGAGPQTNTVFARSILSYGTVRSVEGRVVELDGRRLLVGGDQHALQPALAALAVGLTMSRSRSATVLPIDRWKCAGVRRLRSRPGLVTSRV